LTTEPVNLSLLIGMICLLICCPSTRTLFSLIMSIMTANLPSNGPKLILATLPTSTNLVNVWINKIVPLVKIINYFLYKNII
jgi:hypothetical protein